MVNDLWLKPISPPTNAFNFCGSAHRLCHNFPGHRARMAEDYTVRLSMAYMGIEDRHFSTTELNNTFRTQAAVVHPRKGGSIEGYNTLVEHYRNLFRYAAERDSPKSAGKPAAGAAHTQAVKRCSGSGVDAHNPNSAMQPSGQFDNKAFNEMFEHFYQGGPLKDRGYGSAMAPTSATREEINIPKNLTNTAAVVQAFEDIPMDTHAYIVQPSGVACTNLGYLELGIEDTDFSGNSSHSSLVYTDYMRAHTTSRLAGVDKSAWRPRNYEEMKDTYKRDRESFRMATTDDYMDNLQREHNEHMQRVEKIAVEDARIQQNFQDRNAALGQWMSRIFKNSGRVQTPGSTAGAAAVTATAVSPAKA